MTLRSNPLPNTASPQQRPPTVDSAVSTSPVSHKREPGQSATEAYATPGGHTPDKPRELSRRYMSSVGPAALRAESTPQGLPSPTRPMGGESAQVKGQPLCLDSMDNPPMAFNHNTEGGGGARGDVPGVLGAASIELSHEGKWKNVRKTSPHPAAQASCLRQILLLQLDLIEQQQQQMQAKDRQIDELKNDKDTLLARIERMERRLQLTRKEPPKDKRLFQPLEPWTPGKEDMWDLEEEETTTTTTTMTTTATTTTTQPLQGQPTSLSPARGDKNNKSSRKSSPADSRPQKCRSKSLKESSVKVEMRPGSPTFRELRSKEASDFSLPKSERETPIKEEGESGNQIDELPFMSTTEMYLCCSNQPPLSPLRETSPKKEEEVAIPSWRENTIAPLPIESSYNPHELMDDGTFLKRHMKLELDEKRRKRWDIQRIREQRMYQRLQQRMNRKKVVTESEPELCSFYPDTEDVESIEVTPFLPVVAFGRPLPRLNPENFELPWLDDRSRCRIEVPKKHTPHRTCRK